MATITITGGTGMIGSALTKALLNKGHGVIILTRKAKPSSGGIRYMEWDVQKGTMDPLAITEADYIMHLAGANVGEKRWTPARKKQIVDSRVKSGQLLVDTMQRHANPVKAVISASAQGWYGPDPQIPNPNPFVETDPPDDSFLGRTCAAWEKAISPVRELGKRLIIFRTTIVLSNAGGAYAEFKKPLRFGVAPVLGTGKQVISWIHIDDIVRLYLSAIENNWQGVYNAGTPHPVTNKELVLTMAQTKNKFYIPVPVPAFALKAILGEMSIEVLKSTTVSSNKVEATGFRFLYPTLADAVRELEGK